MITGLAHTAVCVSNVEAAVDWYRSVLGLRVLIPATQMEGEALEQDMGDFVPGIVLKAAILGFEGKSDHVLEVIEYPKHGGRPRPADATITDQGFTHIGLVCEDIRQTRADLEAKGVEFLTRGIAEIAGLKTTWLRDPYGLIYILIEKSHSSKPYYAQMF